MGKQIKLFSLLLAYLWSSVAFAANYYFKAGSDNNWSNKSNWYSNSSRTTPMRKAPVDDPEAVVIIPAGETVIFDAGLTAIGATSNPLAGSGYGINIKSLSLKEGASLVQGVSRLAISLPSNGSISIDGSLTLNSDGEFIIVSTSPTDPQVPSVSFESELSLSGSAPCQIFLPFSDSSESVWNTTGLDDYRAAYPSAIHFNSRVEGNGGYFVYNASNGNWDDWNNWVVNDLAEGIYLAEQGYGYYPGIATADFSSSGSYALHDEVVIPSSSSVRLEHGDVLAGSVEVNGQLTYASATAGLAPSVEIVGSGKLFVSDPAQATADNVAAFASAGGSLAFYCESSSAISFASAVSNYSNLVITPEGDLEVLAGSLVIDGDATIEGKLTLAEGASLYVNGSLLGNGQIVCASASQLVVASGTASFEAEGGSISVGSGSSDVVSEYSGGSGSELDPFVLRTVDDLDHLAAMANSGAYDDQLTYFVLADDIVYNPSLIGAGGTIAAGANIWTPIGTSAHSPKINFAGANHSISGIYVPAGTDNVGLFGYLADDSQVLNLSVENSYIVGQNNVGGVVGSANSVFISGVSFSGLVSGATNVGGVAGALSGTLSNAVNRGSVSGLTSNVGGVVGAATSATISKSANKGEVAAYAANNVGGIIGSALNVTATYNANEAQIGGANNVGGVVGSADHDNDQTHVNGNINVADVLGTTNVGGVAGLLASTYGRTVEAQGNINYGYVEGSTATGGVIGLYDGATLSKNVNVGNVSGQGAIVGSVVGSNSGISSNYYDAQVVSAEGGVAGSDVAGVAEAVKTSQLISGSLIGSAYISETAGFYPLPAQAPISDKVRVNAAAIILDASGAAPETLGSISSDFSVSVADGFSWTQSGDVLQIAPDGSVTIVDKGEMTLSVSYGSASKDFHLSVNVLSNCVVTLKTYDPSFYIFRGEDIRPEVESVKVGLKVIPADQYDVTYSFNKAVGTAKVVVTPAAGSTFAGSGSTTFEIVAAPTISLSALELSSNSVVYNGCVQKPEVSLVLDADALASVWPESAGHKVTVEPSYTINTGVRDFSYSDIYRVTYVGGFSNKGIYSISASVGDLPVLALASFSDAEGVHSMEVTLVAGDRVSNNFTIEARQLDESADFSFSLEQTSYPYDGTLHQPAVTVMFTTGCADQPVKLVSPGDYTVQYSNNQNPTAAAVVSITGKGNFVGSHVLNFEITAPSIEDFEFDYDQSFTYTGSAIEPEIYGVITDADVSPSDYEIVGFENNVDPTSEAYILVEGRNNYSGSVKLPFTILPVPARDVTVVGIDTDNGYPFNGKEQKPAFQVKFAGKTFSAAELAEEFDVLWPSDDYVNVTNDDKQIKLVAKGNHFSGSKTVGFQIVPIQFNTTNVSVEPIEDQYFTGSPITPEVVVKIGDIVLEAKNYRATYSANTNVGTAKITLRHQAPNFSNGSISVNFRIKQISLDDAVVSGCEDPFTFTGSEIRPALTVQVNGQTLEEGTHYMVTVDGDNINVGTPSLILSGINNYAGSKEVPFEIVAANLSDCTFAPLGDGNYNAGAKVAPSSSPSVSLGDYMLVENVDYTVEYSNNTNAGIAVATYYSKSANFDGEKVQNYVINKALLTQTIFADFKDVYPYTGSAIEPVVNLIFKGKPVDNSGNSQFTCSYQNNIEIGEAKVTVTATDEGNFSGSIVKTFVIEALSIEDAVVAAVFPVDYTAKAIQPTPSVTFYTNSGDAITLVAGRDFQYAYANNTNAGQATITVSGIGAYSGSQSINFTINAVDLSSGLISYTLEPSSVVYSGDAFTPVPVLMLGDVTLAEGVDYVLAYDNNINQGTAHVIATAYSDNFSNALSMSFNIEKADLSETVVALDESEFFYTGEDVEPTISLTYNGNTVSPDQYYVSYTNNRDAGEASLVITPKESSNFKGRQDVPFVIKPCPVSSLVVSAIEDQEYSAADLTPSVKVSATIGGKNVNLVLDSDYSVSFENNRNVGVADVVISGIGNYSASKTVHFNITPVNIGTSRRVFLDNIPQYVYQGRAITPNDVLSMRLDGVDLVLDTDFTVEYSNNIYPGFANVTISGKAPNFVGSKSTQFEITKVPISSANVLGVESSYNYTGMDIVPDPAPVLKIGDTVIPTDQYTVSYSNNREPGLALITFTAKDGSDIYMGKLDYNFVIDAIDLKDVFLNGQINAQNFTYAEVQPHLTDNIGFAINVKNQYGGTEYRQLQVGRDFNIVYLNNINAGDEAILRIVGNASIEYSGSKDFKFSIKQQDLGNGQVSLSGIVTPMKYTGMPVLQAKYVLTFNGKTLAEDVDYTVSYVNNVEVGSAQVIFTGKGNFYGSLTGYYNIEGISLDDCSITLEKSEYRYTSQQIRPKVVVVYNGETLVEGTHYELQYPGEQNQNVVPGTGNTLTVVGKYPVSGNKELSFEILKADLTEPGVAKYTNLPDQYYTGRYLLPATTGTNYNFITNGSFESQFTGWTNNGMQTQSNNESGNLKVGTYYCEKWVQAPGHVANASVTQTINVPAGDYIFAANCQALLQGNDAANIVGASLFIGDQSVPVTARGTYAIPYHSDGGSVTIGFRVENTNANWVAVDNFTFITPGTVYVLDCQRLNVSTGAHGVLDVRKTYVDNLNAGTGYCVYTPVDMCYYTNPLYIPFVIKPVDFAGSYSTVDLKTKSFTYTGKPITFDYTNFAIKNNNQDVLLSESGFDLEAWTNNVDAGTASVTVVGHDGTNFINSKTINFTIEKANLSSVNIENLLDVFAGGTPHYTYNGLDVNTAVDQFNYSISGNVLTLTIKSSKNFTGTATINLQAKDFTGVGVLTTTEPYREDLSNQTSAITNGTTSAWTYIDQNRTKYANNKFYRRQARTIRQTRQVKETYVEGDKTSEIKSSFIGSVSETYYYTGSPIQPTLDQIKVRGTDVSSNTIVGVTKVCSFTQSRDHVEYQYEWWTKQTGGNTTTAPNGFRLPTEDEPWENGATNCTETPYSKSSTPVTTSYDVRSADGFKIVSYSNNTNVSDEATVTIIGFNGYKNTLDCHFSIKPLDLNRVAWANGLNNGGSTSSSNANAAYGLAAGDFVVYDYAIEKNGTGMYYGASETNHPSFLLRYKQTLLNGCRSVDGVPDDPDCQGDFNYTYQNCDKVGTASIVISASPSNPNFVGSTKVNYNIQQGELVWFPAYLEPKEYEWTGYAIKPLPELRDDVTNWVLPKKNNYEVFYMEGDKVKTNPIEVGNYYVGAYSITTNIRGTLRTAGSLTEGKTVTATLFNSGAIYDKATGYQAYSIIPCKLSNIKFNDIDDQVFTWTHLDPVPSFYLQNPDGSKYNFVPGTDFSYEQKNSGVQLPSDDEYEIVITLLRGAPGQVLSQNFKVVPANLETSNIAVSIADATYDGTEKTPLPEVIFTDRDGNKHSLVASDTDTENVTLRYENNVNAGTATVYITGTGKRFVGTISKNFNIAKAPLSQCVPKGVDSYKVEWTCRGLAVPEVSLEDPTSGVAVDASEYTVITTSSDLSGNFGDTRNIKLTAKASSNYTGDCYVPVTISQLSIKEGNSNVIVDILNPDDLFYNGSEVKPQYRVLYIWGPGSSDFCELHSKESGNADWCFEDAKVTYLNNTEAGEATIQIHFDNNCTGDFSGKFFIKSLNLPEPEIGRIVVSSPIASATFTGDKVKPAVDPVITFYPNNDNDNDPYVLTAGSDYKVDYKNNVNAYDTPVIEFIGINKFRGTRTATFDIEQANFADAEFSVTSINAEYEYTGVDIKPKPIFTFGSYRLRENVDYTLSWVNYDVVSTDDAPAKVVVTPLASGNFAGAAREFTYKIIGRNLTAFSRITKIADQVCTGEAITPAFDLIFSLDGVETTLRPGVDYDYVFSNNVKVGKATLTVTAKGLYRGTFVENFNIKSINLATDSKITVDAIAPQAYTGSRVELVPEPKIYYNGVALKKGSGLDYTVSYQKNTNPGQATITFTASNSGGTNRFINSKSVNFTILQPSMGDGTIDPMGPYPYNGDVQKPLPVFRMSGSVVDASNYTVRYDPSAPQAVGEYTCFVTAAGGIYSGILSTTFEISPVDIVNANVEPNPIPDQDATGRPVTPSYTVSYAFAGGNTTLAEGVDYTATVSSNVEGTATITITGKGNYTGTKTVQFEIKKISLDASKNDKVKADFIPSMTYTGSPLVPRSTPTIQYNGVRLRVNTDYTMEYSNNVNVGMATATYVGKGIYTDSYVSEFEILAADINGASVTFNKTSYPYTGSAITPGITVKYQGKTLVENVDFTVVVKPTDNNVNRGAGAITLVGKGNFKGEKRCPFTIGPANIADATVAPLTAVTFDGLAKEPVVSVSMNGKTLVKGTDYDCVYDKNINRGSGLVFIQGKNNYEGEKVVSFDIKPLELTSSLIKVNGLTNQTFTGFELTPAPQVVFANRTASQTLKAGAAGDYTLTYANNVNVGKASVSISSTELASSNFTGARVEEFNIVQADFTNCTVSGYDPKYTYTGSAIQPQGIVVKLGSYTLPASDYSVSYGENVKVGKTSGSITVTSDGSGNFTAGSVKVNFEIAPMSVASATVSNVVDKTYNGLKQTQSGYVVTLGGKTLVEGTDFTVSYSGLCTNVQDDAALVITGKGNYTGTKSVPFKILPLDIADPLVLVGDLTPAGPYPYKGSKYEPQPSLSFLSNGLGLNTDYTVTWNNNVNAGTANIVVKAANRSNFTGTRTIPFEIATVDIADVTVLGLAASYVYTGSQITPSGFTVNYNSVTQPASSYVVSYGENINSGSKAGSVTFTAVEGGNFTPGTTKTVKFDIATVALRTFNVGSFVYNGSPIEPSGISGSFVDKGVTYQVVEGRDFEVTGYRNNVNVGTAYIDIKGINGFSGKVSLSFSITQASLTASLPWVKANYNGGVQFPEPIVKDAVTGNVLTRGTHYTVRYSVANSVNVGSYTVSVAGTGNYSPNSKVSLGYEIAKAALTVQGGSFTITYGDDVPASLYTLNGLVGNDTESSALSSLRVTCNYKKWDAVGNYPISVAAATSTNYVVTRRNGSIKVVARDIDEASADPIVDPVYCGSEVRPAVNLTFGGKTLVEGVDFTVRYSNNVSIGTATITISGRGNYTGTKSLQFNVLATEYTWQGLVSADWFTGDNWAGGAVPDANSDVLIFAGSANDPHVDGDSDVALAKSVRVAGGELTVEGYGRLFVADDITVDESANFVVNQRFDQMPSVCANSVVDAAGNALNRVVVNRTLMPFVMYYLGSVTTEGTVSSGISEYDYCSAYSPVTEAYTNYSDFTSAPTYGFNVGIGSDDFEATFTQQGSLMSRSKSVNYTLLSRERLASDSEDIPDYGWNLLSNPYPFTIPMSADFFVCGQNVDPVVWFPCYDYANDINKFKTYNLLLNTSVGSEYSESDSEGSIPSGQAFFVRKNGVANSTFQINPAAIKSSDFAQTAKLKSVQTVSDVLRITVCSVGGNTDEVALVFRDGGSEGLVYGDAVKMQNDSYLNQIAVRKSNQYFVIPYLPRVKDLTSEVALQVRAAASASKISIAATNMDLFDSNVDVYLLDKELNRKIDLRSVASYSANVTAGAVYEDRFALLLVDNTPEDELVNPGVLTPVAPVAQDVVARLWKDDSGAVVIESSEDASLRIYDLAGRVVATFEVKKGISKIDAGLQLNVYVYMLTTESGVIERKLF